MQSEERTLADYFAIVRWHWKVSVAAGTAVLTGFVLYAYLTPPVYEGSATVQVQQPIVPDVADYTLAFEQLVPVTQQVLSVENVARVIEKYNLYPEARGTAPIEELVAAFRLNTVVAPAVVSTTGTGRGTATTTHAYTIAFRYTEALRAAEVANELAQLHVAEADAMRVGTAAKTSEFLKAEADKVALQIADVQARIAALLARGDGVVASQDPLLAAQRYEQIERELSQVDAALRAARERKDVLESEALQTPRYRAVMTDGQTVMRGEERLVVAQQDLVALQARYSDDHPDIQRLKREIATLTGGSADRSLLASQLRGSIAATEQQLETALRTYSDDHPDVQRLRRTLDSQRRQLTEVQSGGASRAPPPPDNPLYLQLQTRIRTAEIEVNELTSRRYALASRLAQYVYDPEVDAKFAPLARERDLLQEQHESLRQRYTQALLAESVETGAKGQLLVFAEPARMPRAPVEPNRRMLLLLGMLLCVGAAFGSASLADLLNNSVRGSRDIEALLRQPPLAVVPYLHSPRTFLHRHRSGATTAIGALVTAAASILWLSS